MGFLTLQGLSESQKALLIVVTVGKARDDIGVPGPGMRLFTYSQFTGTSKPVYFKGKGVLKDVKNINLSFNKDRIPYITFVKQVLTEEAGRERGKLNLSR